MKYAPRTIRTFIGSKNFNLSREFYQELGFKEVKIDDDMSLFKVTDSLSFYLQDYYVKKWVENSMVFMEVDNIHMCLEDLKSRNLTDKFKGVRLSGIKDFVWGREVFLHDPAGVLWHFCEFNT